MVFAFFKYCNMTKSVVIPIYKSLPDHFESCSFVQCLKVLTKHPICIITHDKLDVSYYINVLNKYGVNFTIKTFHEKYFESVAGYNELLLSFEFYNSFSDNEYILIYQLDAWVFRDELDYWCNKGYDYIGAPWFENYGSFEEGNALWAVGNGGFSLRRIPCFLNLFNERYLFTIKELIKTHRPSSCSIKFLKRLFKALVQRFGNRNNVRYFIKKWSLNEDGFWAHFFQHSNMALKIPGCIEAASFSFDQSPQYLFELKDNKLPFGCHAWYRYQYSNFWKYYISV